MEEYYQEAGRAGRDVSYNCCDISKAKRDLQDTMIKFVKSTTECKREIIRHHFRHSAPKRRDGGHNCCDYHRNICLCEHCKLKRKNRILLVRILCLIQHLPPGQGAVS